eukprot:403372105
MGPNMGVAMVPTMGVTMVPMMGAQMDPRFGNPYQKPQTHRITQIGPSPFLDESQQNLLKNPFGGGAMHADEGEIDYILKFNFKFSPFDSPIKIYEKMQKDFDRVFASNRLRTLEGIAKFLDAIEAQMDKIDKERERQEKQIQEKAKILFPTRIREMWLSSFIQLYIKNDGDIGSSLSEEEAKGLKVDNLVIHSTYDDFEENYKSYKFQDRLDTFTKNHKTFADLYLHILNSKDKNPSLSFDELSKRRLPKILCLKAESRYQIKYEKTHEIGWKKRRQEQFYQRVEEYRSYVKQVMDMMDQYPDIIHFEGFLQEPIQHFEIKKRLEPPCEMILQKFGENTTVRSLIISEPRTVEVGCMDCFPDFKGKEDSQATEQILESILKGQASKTLECLQLKKVPMTEMILTQIKAILGLNTLQVLNLSGCKLGQRQKRWTALGMQCGYNTRSPIFDNFFEDLFDSNKSLQVLILDDCRLGDQDGAILLKSLARNIEQKIYLNKLVLSNNKLGDQSAEQLLEILQLCPLQHLDISNNRIFYDALNSIIILCGYKPRLEVFCIDGNQRNFRPWCHTFTKRYCYCCTFSCYNSVANSKVDSSLLEAAKSRVKKTENNLLFAQASKNIFKHRKYENYANNVAEELRKQILEEQKKEYQEQIQLIKQQQDLAAQKQNQPQQITVSVNPVISLTQNTNNNANGLTGNSIGNDQIANKSANDQNSSYKENDQNSTGFAPQDDYIATKQI